MERPYESRAISLACTSPARSGAQAGGIAVLLLQHAQHVDVAVEGADKLLTYQLRRGGDPNKGDTTKLGYRDTLRMLTDAECTA